MSGLQHFLAVLYFVLQLHCPLERFRSGTSGLDVLLFADIFCCCCKQKYIQMTVLTVDYAILGFNLLPNSLQSLILNVDKDNLTAQLLPLTCIFVFALVV